MIGHSVATNNASIIRFRGVSPYGVTSSALEVRKAWMQMMGFTQAEVEHECRHDPPTDLDEELAQYNAIFKIQSINGSK